MRIDWNIEFSIKIFIKFNFGFEMGILLNFILCINGLVEKVIKIDFIK